LLRFKTPVRLSLAIALSLTGRAGLSQVVEPVPPPSAKPAPVNIAKSEDSTLLAAISLRQLDDDVLATSASATTNDSGPAGIVPFLPGFNASLGTTSQHDSASGWASILSPNLAFRFNRHFTANAGLPVYSYTRVYELVSVTPAKGTTPAVDNYAYRIRNFLLGDMAIAGQFEAHPRRLDYSITATVGIPTGNDALGYGAGQPTYNFNNHFEKTFRDRFTPELEIGIGNSPNLLDSRVRKSYIDVGTNAHFQTGLGVQLPWNMSFNSELFEELPLSTQTVTSTTTNGKKGKQLKTITTTSSKSVGEDNGFLNTLDIPVNPHMTLSGFYNRSLRNKIDTAGFSLTFFLKPVRPTEGPR
jgi:hypothetical protein